jgi:hypothetical protein
MRLSGGTITLVSPQTRQHAFDSSVPHASASAGPSPRTIFELKFP